MKKFLLTALAIAVLCTMLCVCTFAADISVGTADELVSVFRNANNWDDNITLTADIDLTGKAISPAGDYDKPFSGTFDGAGYTIKGVNISSEYHATGLFGVIKNATIKNVTVEGYVECTFGADIEKFSAETKVDGLYSGTGAVVGVVLTGCTLENVVNKAEVLGAGNCGGVAGIIYNFEDGTVNLIGCENYGTVDSTVGNVGGVFGRIYTKSTTAATDASFVVATVDGCVNHADLSFTPEDRQRGGGVVGYIRSEEGIVVVQNCRNNGNITGTNEGQFSSNIPYIGGIVGRNELATGSSAALTLKDCINVGDITSSRITGGITSYISRGEACNVNPITVTGCVNLGDVNGSYFAGGIATYVEFNGMLNTPVIENCLNTGNITFDFFEGQEYANTGTNQEAVGGICARNRGANIRNCVNLGVVATDDTYRVLSGALVGKMDKEMEVPCEIAGNYYLYTPMVLGLSMFPNTSNTAIGSADAANKATYATLDFECAWTMADNCPIPTVFAAEAANVTVAEGIELPGAEPEETTAAVEETTKAPDVTEPTGDDKGGAKILPIIIAVVAVIAVAAVVVVIIKKKK